MCVRGSEYCCCLVTKSCPTHLHPHGLWPIGLLWSMGFLRQECWCGLPFPSPGDHPEPGIKPKPSPALAGGFFTTKPPWKP